MRERAGGDEGEEAGQQELLAHLDQLPPVDARLVVLGEEAERRLLGAAPPKEQRAVQQRYTHTVERDGEPRRHDDRAVLGAADRARGALLLVVGAQEARLLCVSSQVGGRVLEAVARGECTEAARRDRRVDEEGPVEHKRERRAQRLAAHSDDDHRYERHTKRRKRHKEQLVGERRHAKARESSGEPRQQVQVGEGRKKPTMRSYSGG